MVKLHEKRVFENKKTGGIMMKQQARMKRLLVAVLTAALVVGGGPQVVAAGSLDGTENKTEETAEILETDKETPLVNPATTKNGESNSVEGGETDLNLPGGGEKNDNKLPKDGENNPQPLPVSEGDEENAPEAGENLPIEETQNPGENPPAEGTQNPEEGGSGADPEVKTDPENGG